MIDALYYQLHVYIDLRISAILNQIPGVYQKKEL